jgi:anti-sigma regulatory factor (Ser/Thr protein kinase)
MATLLVPHEAVSAARVRHALFDDLADRGIDRDSIDAIVLIASELLANAVRHATPGRAGLRVSWELDADTIRIEVADEDPDTPSPRVPRPTDSGGRGLTIVDALSYEWGYDRLAHGKRVWARIPVRVASMA